MNVIEYASYISFGLAGVALALSVYLFFYLKIKDVIYEVSGKAKNETIKKMNNSHSETGSLRKTGMTSILEESSGETGGSTSGLTSSGRIRQTGKTGQPTHSQFRITKDVVVVHTNEYIQFS